MSCKRGCRWVSNTACMPVLLTHLHHLLQDTPMCSVRVVCGSPVSHLGMLELPCYSPRMLHLHQGRLLGKLSLGSVLDEACMHCCAKQISLCDSAPCEVQPDQTFSPCQLSSTAMHEQSASCPQFEGLELASFAPGCCCCCRCCCRCCCA